MAKYTRMASAMASPRKISSASLDRWISAEIRGSAFISMTPMTTIMARARAMVKPR